MTSDFHYAFGLLNRLELPYEMNDLKLSLSKCPPSDLLWTLGPYLRDRVQHRPRDSLGILAYPDLTPFYIRVGDAFETGGATRVEFFMTVEGTATLYLESLLRTTSIKWFPLLTPPGLQSLHMYCNNYCS